MKIEDIYNLEQEFDISKRETQMIKVLERYSKIKMPEIKTIEEQEEYIRIASKTIMMDIENSNYDFFWKMVNRPNSSLVYFMSFSSKIEDIKNIVDNRKSLNLGKNTLTSLIIATKDNAYIKDCVVNSKSMGLEDYYVYFLIRATNEKEYMKSCIEDREKLGLASYLIAFLIEGIGDEEYTKSCINNRKELQLESYLLKDLIKSTKNREYIKSCIENRENLGLLSEEVLELIIATQDKEYMKECIENREILGINTYKKIKKLILAIDDKEYIKMCIKNSKKLGLSLENINDLIAEIGNVEFIKELIKDREDMNLEQPILVNLILLVGDLEYIEECEKSLKLEPEYAEKLKLFTINTKISLPKEMTIGIEIETEGSLDNSRKKVEKFLGKTEWKATGDATLKDGTEVVSPILTGGSEKASNDIKQVCALLTGVSQVISRRCGGHIHIGADFLTTKQDWVNLIQIWSNTEKILYIISNEKGSIPRNGVTENAQPISKRMEQAINFKSINLEGEEELAKFQKALSDAQLSKYYSINFLNIGTNGKNTIEFRIPNGTMNPNTWIENINFFGGMVRSSHELSKIQRKSIEERTPEETKMLQSFDVIQTQNDENQIAEALVDLCVRPEEKGIYMDRYYTNKELFENDHVLKETIISQISVNKIGKKVFTGENAIRGRDYEKGASIIENHLQNMIQERE